MLNVDDLLVVEENLSTVETQLNETNARAGAAPGVFKAEQYGVSSAIILCGDGVCIFTAHIDYLVSTLAQRARLTVHGN